MLKSNLDSSITQPPANLSSDKPVEASSADKPVEISSADKPVEVSSTDQSVEIGSGYIPEPPPIVDENIILNALGEPTLQSIGLGCSYTPCGWVQLALEYLHVDLGLPWLTAIVTFALVLRTCLFPITIKSQKNAVIIRRMGPIIAQLNENLNKAKANGNKLESKLNYFLRIIIFFKIRTI